ncbi:Uncharacterised protein [Streptococcus pneumoniae]|nr:Uncharacterised protein [Streptococcus pneumoniae]
MEFGKTVKCAYGGLLDIYVYKYGEKKVVELENHDDEFTPSFGVDEIDELIKTLQEAKEVLTRGRNTDE